MAAHGRLLYWVMLTMCDAIPKVPDLGGGTRVCVDTDVLPAGYYFCIFVSEDIRAAMFACWCYTDDNARRSPTRC
jgi:hypothetical protein